MRTIKVGGENMPALFTTWTVAEFYKLTGINLYDPSGITKVFKRYSDGEAITPTDFDIVVKLVYCALAAGSMPNDAPDDWKPAFSWKGIMNKLPMNDPTIYGDILSVYFDRDVDAVVEAIKDQNDLEPKNAQAPIAGQ